MKLDVLLDISCMCIVISNAHQSDVINNLSNICLYPLKGIGSYFCNPQLEIIALLICSWGNMISYLFIIYW